MLASGHPGLEINILYYCTLYSEWVSDWVSESHSIVSDSFWPHGLSSPCNSPGQNSEWVAFPFSRWSSQPRSPVLQADSLPGEPQGKPTLYSCVKYTKAQQLIEDTCTWQCTPDRWTNLRDWTCKHNLHLWQFATWGFVCRGLTVLIKEEQESTSGTQEGSRRKEQTQSILYYLTKPLLLHSVRSLESGAWRPLFTFYRLENHSSGHCSGIPSY